MLSLPSYLTTTLLKSYLQQFLLPSTSYPAIKKGTKRKKTQFGGTKQTSEPELAGMLELSDWTFKTTMIYILRAIMDKVKSMHEQMNNISREMQILRKN